MATDDTATEDAVADQIEPTVDEVEIGTEQKALFLTAALAIVGAFLPWYSVLGVSVIGFEGDGLITFVVGIVVLGLVWYFDSAKRSMVTGMIGGLVISLVAFYHVTGVSDMGVYVTVFAGLGMLVASVSGYWKLR